MSILVNGAVIIANAATEGSCGRHNVVVTTANNGMLLFIAGYVVVTLVARYACRRQEGGWKQ